MVRTLGALVDAADRANRLAEELAGVIACRRAHTAQAVRRPEVYFEEWDDPMIAGRPIDWYSFASLSAACRQKLRKPCSRATAIVGGRGSSGRPAALESHQRQVLSY